MSERTYYGGCGCPVDSVNGESKCRCKPEEEYEWNEDEEE
jgi:hypothetical protein